MATDPKVLDRIEKLLQLATNNPNEAEASAAALKAAQLLKEHGLKVGSAAAFPGSVKFDDVTKLWEEIYRGGNMGGGKQQRQGGQAAPPPPPRQGDPFAYAQKQQIEAEVRKRVNAKLTEMQQKIAIVEQGYRIEIAGQAAKLAIAATMEFNLRAELVEVNHTMREAMAENLKLRKAKATEPVGFWAHLAGLLP